MCSYKHKRLSELKSPCILEIPGNTSRSRGALFVLLFSLICDFYLYIATIKSFNLKFAFNGVYDHNITQQHTIIILKHSLFHQMSKHGLNLHKIKAWFVQPNIKSWLLPSEYENIACTTKYPTWFEPSQFQT